MLFPAVHDVDDPLVNRELYDLADLDVDARRVGRRILPQFEAMRYLVSMTYVRISRAAVVRGRLLLGSRGWALNDTLGRSTLYSRHVPFCHSRSAAATTALTMIPPRTNASSVRRVIPHFTPGPPNGTYSVYRDLSNVLGVSSDSATTSAPHFCLRNPLPVVPVTAGRSATERNLMPLLRSRAKSSSSIST